MKWLRGLELLVFIITLMSMNGNVNAEEAKVTGSASVGVFNRYAEACYSSRGRGLLEKI